jgi:hypothetical protein
VLYGLEGSARANREKFEKRKEDDGQDEGADDENQGQSEDLDKGGDQD